jgi:hypothetical protein
MQDSLLTTRSAQDTPPHSHLILLRQLVTSLGIYVRCTLWKPESRKHSSSARACINEAGQAKFNKNDLDPVPGFALIGEALDTLKLKNGELNRLD